MHRPSTYLTMLRAAIEPNAKDKKPIPAALLPTICELLAHLEAECERMEIRLAGKPLGATDFANEKVVSLAAWMASRKSERKA